MLDNGHRRFLITKLITNALKGDEKITYDYVGIHSVIPVSILKGGWFLSNKCVIQVIPVFHSCVMPPFHSTDF